MGKLKSLVAATFRLRSLEQQKEGIKMRKLKSLGLLVVVVVCISAVSVFSAVPLRINYQGRYMENGTPVTGSRDFVFRIVNSGGTTEYWTSNTVTINLQNGLFNYVLEPTGVNWREIEPYFEVTVAGNLLSPRERINTSAYAIYASSAGYAFNALQSNVNSTLQSGTTLFINGEISTTGEAVTISTNVVVEGKVSILETGTSPSYYTGLQGGDQTGNINYTLPTSLPVANNYILASTTVGNLSWVVNAGSAPISSAYVTIGNDDYLTAERALMGTANQITVSTGATTVTLSTPQDIHTGASPTFAGLSLGTGQLNTVGSIVPAAATSYDCGFTNRWRNVIAQYHIGAWKGEGVTNPGLLYDQNTSRTILQAHNDSFQILNAAGSAYQYTTSAAAHSWYLATKACLQIDTTNKAVITYDGGLGYLLTLGSGSYYWPNVYVSTITLNSTAYLSGATAGVVTVGGGALYLNDSNVAIQEWGTNNLGLKATGGNAYFNYGLAALFENSDNTAYDQISYGSIGSSGNYWPYAYISTVTLNSTAYLDGATAGKIGVTGQFKSFTMGAVYLDGDTSNYLLSINTNQTASNYSGLYLGHMGNCATYITQVANGLNIGSTADASTPLIYVGAAGGYLGRVGIGTKTPAYTLDVAGVGQFSDGTISILGASAGQARYIYGNYGVIHRVDGSDYYILLTASADPYGTWNTLRPFRINLANGGVSIGNGLTVTGNVKVSGQISPRVVYIKCIAETTILTIEDGKAYFTVPTELNGYNLVDADAAIYTAGGAGSLTTIQIANATDGVDMLTTKITIDLNEKTSYTAATPPVIDTTKDDVVTADQLRVDVDAVATGPVAQGLDVILTFQLP